jgi:hypothetical protein
MELEESKQGNQRDSPTRLRPGQGTHIEREWKMEIKTAGQLIAELRDWEPTE